MNLNNESSSSREFSIEELVKMNGDAMAVMDEVPYQPIVYAVPREWLESWRILLAQAVQFQPTLYGMLTPLATQERLQKQEMQLKAELGITKRDLLKRVAELERQDGNSRERFFSELSKLYSDTLREMREEYAKQIKESKRYLWVTTLASAVLSALVCGVFLLLAA